MGGDLAADASGAVDWCRLRLANLARIVRLRARNVISQIDQHQMLKTGDPRQLRQERIQQIAPRKRREGHENPGAGRGDQRRQRRRLQQRVEQSDDSCRLSAPDGEMGLGKIGKNDGDNIVLADAERVKQHWRSG